MWGYFEARTLRDIEKKAPELVRIVKAKERPPGHMRQPYFGCIATAKARRALANAQGATP